MVLEDDEDGTIWLTHLCGNISLQDAFWSPAITINSTNPDFTTCFHNTALVWIPCVFLWLCFPFYMAYLSTQKYTHGTCDFSRMLVAKLVLGLLLLVCNVIQFFHICLWSDGPPAPWSAQIIYFSTLVLAQFLMKFEYSKGQQSSGTVFCFWLLMVIANVFTLRKYTQDAVQYGTFEDETLFTVYCVFFSLLCIQFVLHLFADVGALERTEIIYDTEIQPLLSKEPICPEPRASFLSRMTFMWTWRLLLDGYRKCLTGDRLYQLRPSETAEPIIEKFHKDWVKIGKNKGQFNTTETKMTQFSSLKNENGSRTWMTNSSIVMSCVRSFGLHYAAVGIFEVVNIVLTFIRPAILDALITFVTTTDKFTWRGYLYAFLLFIITILRSIFQQQHFFGKFLSGQRARSALICAVYRKTLLLAGSARKKFSVGEIVNFMAVDAQRVSDVTFTMHTIWSSIVQCIVAMVMLWGYLGPSSLGGLAVLVISIAINIFLAAQQKKLQRKAMKLKDKRIKLTNEILNGIKILKLYVWESAFQNKLKVIRDEELANIKKASFFATGVIISFTCAPILYTVVSFSLYILVAGNRALSAQVAFVSLSLVGALTRPLTFLPNGITSFVQAQVSVTRLQNFLNDEELNPNDISPNVTGSNVIEIDDGTFTWEGKEAQPILKDINLKIKRGSFTAIVGQVGSGKSTLLSAMLGELYKVEGSIRRWGRVAYVPQVAWIRNMTLKSNVLFQKSVHKDKYDQVIEACELVPDIKILPAGDMTEIGEKGINLSGGQKQRVSLARAVYQDMDIYLMDDPLSAVDAHVAKNLFAKVIGPKGMLAHKTRVLVTHSVTYLPQADHIITMKDGQISEMGTYDELLSNNGAFAELMKNYLNEIEMEEDLNEEDEKLKVELKRQFSDMSDAASDSSGMTEKSGSETPRRRRRGTRTSQIESDQAKLDSTNIDQAAKRIQDGKKLIEAETVQTGRIQLAVMKSYLTSLGLAATTIVLIAYVCQLTSDLGSTIWLSEWSLDEDRSVNETVDPKIRVGVYGGIGAANTISVMVQAIVIAIACVTAAGSFHDRLMDRIVKAPVLFFETTPLGRILNRFSQDMNVVDSSIRNTIITCMRGISGMITTVIAISYTSPIFILIVIPLTVLYYLTQRFYVGSANQLRRLMNVRTSPIYSHFGESVAGATSIRAYKLQSSFEQDSEKLVDQMQMGRFPTLATNRWLSISLELLGAFVVLSAGLFAVVSRETITGGLVGLSVSYALQVTDRLALFVRNISDFENNVVALERIKEYSEIETEAPWEIEENRPREDWPNEGKVKFEQYSTRYRPGLDLVLEKINCSISASEKIGIVGRTGAGKSSMTVALFRIIEAVEGCIYIDDVGIGGIGLHDLRKKITIIPQDPVLFSGTIRFNLDPFNKHTDQEIWNALEQAHLKYFISSLPDQISHECTEGGSNLSVGQRQLVCLARALLRKTKILVLDEATAAVDLETDDLIQSTIRTEFSDCTVITIAHRLHTVLDNDRIIVMDSGSIKEFDTPDNLLQDSESTFYTMCKVAGILPQ